MFKMKRRLIAAGAVAALALASVMPASAGWAYVTHPSCSSHTAVGYTGQTGSIGYGQTYVQASCGWLGVHYSWYDPSTGSYIWNSLQAGSGTGYYSQIGFPTPGFSYHHYGPNISNYSTLSSYG